MDIAFVIKCTARWFTQLLTYYTSVTKQSNVLARYGELLNAAIECVWYIHYFLSIHRHSIATFFLWCSTCGACRVPRQTVVLKWCHLQ